MLHGTTESANKLPMHPQLCMIEKKEKKEKEKKIKTHTLSIPTWLTTLNFFLIFISNPACRCRNMLEKESTRISYKHFKSS